MRAMVLRAPGELVPGDVVRPAGAADHVLVRVTYSGICGTDLKIYRGTIPVTYPRIMGHEMAGDVVEPDAAGTFRPGERVVIDPQLYCGACFQCRSGRTHLCPGGQLIGRDTDGGFAEYVAVPVGHVFRVPDEIESRIVPLIQVLTTCLHAQRQVAIFPGESVAVLGLGVTGLLHAQLSKARGASPVIGVTRSADKRALAQTLGADLAVPWDAGTIDRVRTATEGRGADVVIETTGVLSSLAAAVDMARRGGRILLFGIITAKEGALPFYDLYFKELTLVGARVARSEDYPSALGLVQRGLVRLEPLVTDVLPLDELGTAIDMLGSDGAGRVKIILDHSPRTHAR